MNFWNDNIIYHTKKWNLWIQKICQSGSIQKNKIKSSNEEFIIEMH
jgi:hypothetical protein